MCESGVGRFESRMTGIGQRVCLSMRRGARRCGAIASLSWGEGCLRSSGGKRACMWRDLEGGTADWCCASVIGRQHCRDTRVRCVLFAVCFVVENVFVIAVRKRHDPSHLIYLHRPPYTHPPSLHSRRAYPSSVTDILRLLGTRALLVHAPARTLEKFLSELKRSHWCTTAERSPSSSST